MPTFYILLSEMKILVFSTLGLLLTLPTLNKRVPLVVVAEDGDAESLSTMAVNRLNVGAVNILGFGQNRKYHLEIMAIATMATLQYLGLNLEDVEAHVSRKVREVIATKDNAVFSKEKVKRTQVEKCIEEITHSN